MGNDISVFEEGELEKDFWKAYGPKNESWTEFFARSFAGLTKILMQPSRMEYEASDVESRSEDTDFRHQLFSIPGAGGEGERHQLAAALWSQGQNRVGVTPRPVVLYLHTNTRCLLDAKEVLPVCDELGASLLAFDLPGCGHSEGNLTFQMTQDLHQVVLFAHRELGYKEIVLWARGMSTAIAVEYCTISVLKPSTHTPCPDYSIKFIVLDTPYTSVKQMVVDGSKAIKCFGLSIPETMVRIACRVVRGKVSARLGSDPFDLKPLRLVEAAAEQGGSGRAEPANASLPPCHIFSAQNDDYIPLSHGHDMQQAWRKGAECGLQEFPGRHFGERNTELLLGAVNDIKSSLVFDKQKAEAEALATVNVDGFMAGGPKIPWVTLRLFEYPMMRAFCFPW
mmetsp:Transcript_12789/g.20853  ORF Transcript_12789/g.20853 Transcript_12789/m.20853 type:complete len:395 (-) Transcript_12789:183-1367(-)